MATSNKARYTRSRYTDPEHIITTPVELTTEWQNIGGLVDSRSFTELCFFIQLSIGDGLNNQIRLLGYDAEASSVAYFNPLMVDTIEGTEIDYSIYKILNNEDQNIMFMASICPAMYTRIQARGLTAGSTISTFKLAVSQ